MMPLFDSVLASFTNNPFLAVLAVIALAIVCKMITKIATGLSRERSRREIAAYIAEGSMTPDDGVRLLGEDRQSSC